MIWSVDTAQGNGLDIWGRIVGVVRTITIPSLGSSFGFEEAGNSWTGFNQSPFYGGQQLGTTFSLLDPDFRRLIMAKAATNICDGSIPSINAILLALFPRRGDCFVVDLGGMSMQYKFNFVLTSVELAIVLTSGALPRPAGVSAAVVHL